MSELNQLRRQFILEIKERIESARVAVLYTKYRDGKPYQYRYGGDLAEIKLELEGGYPTPEEAIAAWEREQAST